MEILKVKNLTKIYGKDMAKVTALDNYFTRICLS